MSIYAPAAESARVSALATLAYLARCAERKGNTARAEELRRIEAETQQPGGLTR